LRTTRRSSSSRRTEPTNLSAVLFCHGLWEAVRVGQISKLSIACVRLVVGEGGGAWELGESRCIPHPRSPRSAPLGSASPEGGRGGRNAFYRASVWGSAPPRAAEPRWRRRECRASTLRPGPGRRRTAQHPGIREVQADVTENPGKDHRVPQLARRARMSTRHFVRVFTQETGEPPAQYVQRVRVERARQMLERDGLSVEEVAASCGLGSAETMRRRFQQSLGVCPSADRARFTSRIPA
jgi:AraC-like DNA-binding protein